MMFEVSNLKVHYGGAEILNGVSFNVDEGEVVTLLGSNGAGKTTMLNTITGLKKLTSGEIKFKGNDISRTGIQTIVGMGIAYVPQGRELFPYMTVLENIRLGAYLRKDRAGITADLEGVFKHFPRLKERRQQMARTLSGGEQQMLAIARALMAKPKLLLLDEPSTGLAPLMVQEIGKVALNIRETGTSILLVEQNAQLALKLASRGYVLETGSIVIEGPCKQLLADKRIREAYLGG